VRLEGRGAALLYQFPDRTAAFRRCGLRTAVNIIREFDRDPHRGLHLVSARWAIHGENTPSTAHKSLILGA
jgi:hypothetical protein